MRPNLLAWQWAGYASFHRSAANLWLHIVAVPAFIAAVLSALASFATGQLVRGVVALGVAAVAFLVQGVGHRGEAEAPIPFDGPVDVATRVVAEQFVTFPRFVLSGGWYRALRGG